jgi:hypothetical protein
VRTSVLDTPAIVQALVEAINEPGLIDVTFGDMFTVATLFEGGAVIRGAASKLGGTLSNFSLRLGNAGFARIGNSAANKTFDAVARALRMTPETKNIFRAVLHESKRSVGRGGANNYEYKELLKIGKEFLETYGK